MGKGDFVTAYVGAEGYIINADGSITLEGTRQVINTGNGTAVIQPSFPVYMMKTGGDALALVAAKGGVSFEGSSFRSGVSNFLADDVKLCQYIRQEKWDFDNIATIAENYDPYRRDKDLTIDGEVVILKKRALITDDFNNEMLFYTETVIPPGDINGTQFGIGLHLTSCKFLTYGGDIGFASAKYVDYVKCLENQGINNMATAPVTEADLSKSSLFRFNAFAGVQLPLSVKKMYFVPAVNFTFGGLTSNEYSTLLYGPMATFDVGYRFNQGNILMLGGGFRRNISLKSQEGKDEASAPGFAAYKPYNSLMLRVLYKF